MKFTCKEIGLEGLDSVGNVDSLCLFVAEDERPLRGIAGYVDWRLSGRLSEVLLDGFFTGVPSDWLLVPSSGRLTASRIFVAGLGPSTNLNASTLGEALHGVAQRLARAKVKAVALEIPGIGRVDDSIRASALVHQFAPEFKGSEILIFAEKPLARLLPLN